MMASLLIVAIALASTRPDTETELRRTFNGVCWTESKGDPLAVNRLEDAVGIAQIRPIMVRDANRIIGYQKWTLADRLDPAKSYAIFKLVVRYYAPSGGPEQWARVWNGGGKGHKKPSTWVYWLKIEAAMKETNR
jgi:hypothetical protein